MKNTIKLLGIIALVTVVGFSFVACGNLSNSDEKVDYSDGTYTFMFRLFTLTNANYEGSFGGALPGSNWVFLNGTRETFLFKFTLAAADESEYYEIEGDVGRQFSELEAILEYSDEFPTSTKNKIKNTVKTKGYVVCACKYNEYEIIVLGVTFE